MSESEEIIITELDIFSGLSFFLGILHLEGVFRGNGVSMEYLMASCVSGVSSSIGENGGACTDEGGDDWCEACDFGVEGLGLRERGGVGGHTEGDLGGDFFGVTGGILVVKSNWKLSLTGVSLPCRLTGDSLDAGDRSVFDEEGVLGEDFIGELTRFVTFSGLKKLEMGVTQRPAIFFSFFGFFCFTNSLVEEDFPTFGFILSLHEQI